MKKRQKNNLRTVHPSNQAAVTHVPQLLQKGHALQSQGRAGQAMQHYEQVLRLNPGNPDAVHLQCLALIQQHDYRGAIRFLSRWGKHDSGKNAATQYFVGYGYYLMKRFKLALRHLTNALAHDPAMALARLLVARIQAETGDVAAGRSMLTKPPELAARAVSDVMTHAIVLSQLELYQEARQVLDRLMQKHNMHVEALYELIRLPPETWTGETCEAVASRLAGKTLSAKHQVLLKFSAGRIADQQSHYADAYRYFADAKAQSTKPFDFDVFGKAITGCMDLSEMVNDGNTTADRQSGAVTPVFVVGMPRSGKTTLETLLTRSPEIAACGEISPRFFIDADIFVGPEGQIPENFAERLKSLGPARRNLHAKQYCDGIMQQLSLPHTTRFIVNTLPQNFLNIGVLRHVFPTSKFLYLDRNPKDIFIFCFMKHFMNQYNYTRDFASFMQYHAMFERQISHWQQYLGQDFLTLCYEDVVTSPDDAVASVMDFLGVALPDAHDHTCEIKLTDRFVDYWKHYEDLLPAPETAS
ncbi:sulfotransferase [Anderseniella sp. Alg231-50]|uniref:sulfotransferase n=1 Tax=Anderseniella sp. Alg231-50 TaxID=1922226 RepID=UPI000D55A9DC